MTDYDDAYAERWPDHRDVERERYGMPARPSETVALELRIARLEAKLAAALADAAEARALAKRWRHAATRLRAVKTERRGLSA